MIFKLLFRPFWTLERYIHCSSLPIYQYLQFFSILTMIELSFSLYLRVFGAQRQQQNLFSLLLKMVPTDNS